MNNQLVVVRQRRFLPGDTVIFSLNTLKSQDQQNDGVFDGMPSWCKM